MITRDIDTKEPITEAVTIAKHLRGAPFSAFNARCYTSTPANAGLGRRLRLRSFSSRTGVTRLGRIGSAQSSDCPNRCGDGFAICSALHSRAFLRRAVFYEKTARLAFLG